MAIVTPVRSSMKAQVGKVLQLKSRYTVLSIQAHWIRGEITEITSKLARDERSSSRFLVR